MFGHQPFYFQTMRKMTILFGTYFNNIHITRTDDGGDTTHVFRVPIQYGPKDKEIARINADPEIQRENAILLPRMSFELMNMTYDATRKLSTVGRIIRGNSADANRFQRMYNPVPYNLNFSLWIYSKNIEDANKIVEQILPFFTPEYPATVNIIPEMSIVLDIPTVLDSVDKTDTYQGAFEERRIIVWQLNFTMKTAFFGPIVKKPIIKYSNTQFYVGNTSTTNTKIGIIRVTPGQDANGDATSNAAITVPANTIYVDDNWDYVIEISGEGIIVEE